MHTLYLFCARLRIAPKHAAPLKVLGAQRCHQHIGLQPRMCHMAHSPHTRAVMKAAKHSPPNRRRRPITFHIQPVCHPAVATPAAQIQVSVIHQRHQPPLMQPTRFISGTQRAAFFRLRQRFFTRLAVEPAPMRHAAEQRKTHTPRQQRRQPRQQHQLQRIAQLHTQTAQKRRVSTHSISSIHAAVAPAPASVWTLRSAAPGTGTTGRTPPAHAHQTGIR